MADRVVGRGSRRALRVALAFVALAFVASPAPAQDGHAIRGDQVLVNRASHWRAWQGAASLIDISPTGSVRPLSVRKNTNAALDVAAFAGAGEGGISAGSNSASARNMIDGDPTTSWGPDPASPLSDWWLELHLGRLVVVEKIVIRFAEEGDGDPFLQFRVLGWRQPPPRSTTEYTLAGTTIPRFWEIGRTARPNKTERVFEFDVRPALGIEADALFTGDPMDRLQIVATSSDTTRAQEITKEAFDALPASRQGAVDHYRRELSGRETRISAAEYAAIDPARQGPIRYYRTEIPRITEVEVWTEGDNINIGLADRGGSAFVEGSGGDFKSIGPTISDGSYATGHTGSIFGDEVYEYIQDLGALFWIDTMHFLTDGASAIDEWFVDVSDGTRAPDGSIQYARVGESTSRSTAGHTSATGIRFREIRIEPSKVRFLRSTFQNPLRGLSYIGVTEVLLYGEGFVPEVQLTSDLVRLGASKNLISLEWASDVPEGTAVHLQTRTGNELEEISEYFDSNGNPVTESRYNRLPSSKKGEIRSRFEPGGDWSSWSVPLTTSGAEITSPSPRSFLQLRVTLLTDRQDTAATVHSLSLNMSDPVADRLVGEIFPLRVARIGEADEFTYYIRPDFSSSRQAFDELRIEATAGTHMQLLGLRLGDDDDFSNGTTTDFDAHDVVALSAAPDTLSLRLPQQVTRGTELVEVRMRASILGNSASFRGFVRDSAIDGFWQRIDEGDATDLVSSQRLTVVALEGAQVLQGLRLASTVLTPNGDGVNDRLELSFAVARVISGRPVRLAVYDLAGRLVRRLEEARADTRGRYTMTWDGTDGARTLVPPGIYLVRLEVDADSGTARNTQEQRLVHVAY